MWRHIQRSPGFACAAILTLALGVAANTAMFSSAERAYAAAAIDDPDGLIGVRVAIGATPAAVARAIVRESVALTRSESGLEHPFSDRGCWTRAPQAPPQDCREPCPTQKQRSWLRNRVGWRRRRILRAQRQRERRKLLHGVCLEQERVVDCGDGDVGDA